MKPKPHKKTITTHFQKPPAPAENPSDYAFKITKTAVSQICQSVGFKTTQLSALETLTHVATLCLQTLPKQLYYIPMRLTVLNQTSLTSSTHYMTCILYEVSQEGPHCIVIVVA
jgi:transcription initiation factor TFIID subunit 8